MKKTFVALVLLISCSHGPMSGSSFGSFVDDYFAMRAGYAPSQATRTGFHQYDQQLEDYSKARIGQQVADLKAFQARLAAFDRSTLGFDDQIDADLIDHQIRASLLELTVVKGWQHNPMSYAGLPGRSIDNLMKRDFAPGPERLKSVIARLQQVPRVYAQAKENLVDPPKEFTDLSIRMAKGSVGFLEKAVTGWARGTGADPALLQQFEQADAQAAAAAKDFLQWLQGDLLPRSHGSYAIGAQTFLEKLADEEEVEIPLDQLLDRGMKNLEKDHADFLATAKQIDPKRSPAEVMKELSNDHPAEGDLVPSVARSVEAARQFVVDKDLVTVPSEVRVTVKPTPPYARSGTFASMDTPGPFETRATEAYYYVTPVEDEWDAKHKEEHLRLYNPWVVGMINVHEAYPGHYLEFLYAPRFPTKTRKLTHSSTNSEGWAHYSEQMTVEHGFGNGDPRMHLAQLQEALLRDCRYVVGIQLHTAGWTVEQGAKLFVDKGFQEPANAFEESRRGAYNPTYLYYTLGKLMIQDLARDYMQQKHATLKQFHDAFVAQGALPVPVVRKILMQ
ncbi:MAG TPA: DUF885 domain-containing protein [Myxococcales bacterium]|nr:DUF885 domain-containing protein [Myxococcales bacterium]